MNPSSVLVGQRSGLEWSPAGGARPIERATPTETAIGLSFDRRPHTVLMATPDDVEDLAIGFTLTEGVAGFAEIIDVVVETTADGILVDVRLSPSPRVRK